MKTAIIEYKYYKESFFENMELITANVYDSLEPQIIISNHPVENKKKQIVLRHSNKGKDIGAKLIGIDCLLNLDIKIDALILMHDKRSPQSPLGKYWLTELTKIFREPSWQNVIREIEKKEIGICCSANYIKSEYDRKLKKFKGPNNFHLKKLIEKYGLQNAQPYFFVAGTIFCCKWEPLKIFFQKYPPLTIRATLENGNVEDSENGTYTHSWERIFSWIITSQGYKIKGL